MNDIFSNNFYQLEIYKDGFFEKLKRKILNIIKGKIRLTEVLNKYENENLKQISDNNNLKVIDIFAICTGVLKQIQSIEKEINNQYEMSIQNL